MYTYKFLFISRWFIDWTESESIERATEVIRECAKKYFAREMSGSDGGDL